MSIPRYMIEISNRITIDEIIRNQKLGEENEYRRAVVEVYELVHEKITLAQLNSETSCTIRLRGVYQSILREVVYALHQDGLVADNGRSSITVYWDHILKNFEEEDVLVKLVDDDNESVIN